VIPIYRPRIGYSTDTDNGRAGYSLVASNGEATAVTPTAIVATAVVRPTALVAPAVGLQWGVPVARAPKLMPFAAPSWRT